MALWDEKRKVAVHSAVNVLLTNLRYIHTIWRQKLFVSDEQLCLYAVAIDKFSSAWRALQWAGTVWVHWTIAHSELLLHKHRSLYISSIPTEHKHKKFKVDDRHTCVTHCGRRTRVSRGGLLHLVENHALDVALLLEHPAKKQHT